MADYTCSAKCKNGGAEYTAGDGIVIEDDTISVVGKQDTLTAGDGIDIDINNIISMGGWTFVPKDKVGDLITEDGILTTDILLVTRINEIVYNYGFKGTSILTKGYSISYNFTTYNFAYKYHYITNSNSDIATEKTLKEIITAIVNSTSLYRHVHTFGIGKNSGDIRLTFVNGSENNLTYSTTGDISNSSLLIFKRD